MKSIQNLVIYMQNNNADDPNFHLELTHDIYESYKQPIKSLQPYIPEEKPIFSQIIDDLMNNSEITIVSMN